MTSHPSDVDRSGLADGAREFQLSGHIENPQTGKAYVLDVDAQHGYELLSMTVAGAGVSTSTFDAELLRNGTGVPGMNYADINAAAGTEVKQSASGSQFVAIGDRLSILFDDYAAANDPTDVYFSLLCRDTRINDA